ncbi:MULTISPECIES: TetR/AcrR family transcriptional regulator [unclassified Nocardiopsis]|uniref:TetR/AcrR family transcriptional regulator n=1 Tax=Nocardiopsis TaxID=2013 RepID=UPI00387B3D71
MTSHPGADQGRSEAKQGHQLSSAYIASMALSFIDRFGLEALSMRKLGSALGVDPMTIYHYVPNKSALYDGVVDTIYGEVDFEVIDSDQNWRELVAQYIRRLHAVLRRHPKAVPLIATRPAYTPSVLTSGNRALRLLSDRGISERDALLIINSLRSFSIGHVLAELGEPVGGSTESPESGDAVDWSRYPHMVKAMSGGYHGDEFHEIALQAMLDGFAARLPLLSGND